MSYDRIWIRINELPGGWLERSQAEKLNLSNEFGTICTRLFTQGNIVHLSAGKNFMFDELFLFETGADAQDFYDNGFMKWESLLGDEREGCEFQEVALFRGGLRITTKTGGPTKKIEVKHE